MPFPAEELIRHATLAPSGHNTQPWQFSIHDDGIGIHADFSRRLPVVDPDDHALFVSLGCALENLVIAAARFGYVARTRFEPDGVRVILDRDQGVGDEGPLFDAIALRQSNRSRYDGRGIADDQVAQLLAANRHDTVEVRGFRTCDDAVEPIIELVRDGNVAQFSDREFVEELVSWIRFSRREVETRRDGLAASALGFPSIPRWLGRLIMTRLVTPAGEAARQERAIRSASHLMVFIAREHDRRHWIDLGRSFERITLTAASLGIAHAHVNMPCEVESIRARFAGQLGLTQGEQPLLLIRLGFAKSLPMAPRRPVRDVIRGGRQ